MKERKNRMAELKRTSLEFGAPVDDAVLRQEVSKYEQTRKRVTRFYNNRCMSDSEIIECLAEEIEQYRTRIHDLERIAKGLDGLNRVGEVTSESNTYHCGVDGGTGEDFVVTRWYEDGVLIKEEIKPCKDIKKEETDENDCPPIEIGMHKAL